MKYLLPIFLLFCFHASAQEDTARYMKYPYAYGVQYERVWANKVLRIPDTSVVANVPGAFGKNSAGTAVFIWDGSAWNPVGGGGSSTTDTIYSVIVNTDSIYSIIIRSDTIYSVINNSDTIYAITIRTDSVFTTITNSDTIYSITSRTDTLVVNNNLIIPIRDTADYADPIQGSITFAPSDNNYYGYNGTYWACFTCAGNGTCYRDILIDSSHFSDANTCTDVSIIGSIYAIYWSDLPGYIYEGVDYDLNGTGFDITTANFDATANQYRFHVYTIDTTGACDNAVIITGGGGGTTYSFTAPLQESGAVVTIDNGGADGTTKGAVTFTPSDFNSAAGVISLDINNGQKATVSQPGYMTAAQATTLGTALQNITGLVTAGTNVTVTGSGTGVSPYVINSSGGGGGSTDTTSLSNRINRLVLYHTLQTLTDGGTITLNTNSGYNGTVTLGGDRAFVISNLTAGDQGWIIVIQDATGGRDLTFPSGTQITNGYGSGQIPELSTAASKKDLISYIYDGTRIIITSVLRDIQ